jgi:hypothetical protein
LFRHHNQCTMHQFLKIEAQITGLYYSKRNNP